MLAAVKTVEGEKLAEALDVPFPKREELKKQSTTDEDFKHGLATYFLGTHPFASWAHIGGALLCWEEEEALEGVKAHIVPEQGTQLRIWGGGGGEGAAPPPLPHTQ